MKKSLILTITLCLSCLGLFAQNFTGTIIYANTYTSKMRNVQSDQLTALMGTQMTYYVDGGSYRSDLNGTLMQWQLYVPTDNKLYTKMASNESVFWNDAAEANDEIISTEVHPGAATILGYKCDELVVNCKSGQQKYYFSSKLPMDPKLLTKHNYGNWAAIIAKTKAIPLK